MIPQYAPHQYAPHPYTPQEIAQALGFKFGSEIIMPSHKNPLAMTIGENSSVRQRWSPDVKEAFEWMEPHALVLVGTEGPASLTLRNEHGEEVQRIGGNRGCWPVKIASTGSWKDTVTQTYNRGPFFWCGTLFRVWCESDAHERQLSKPVGELLQIYRESVFGETMLGGFVDVGPDLQIEFFEMEVHSIANRLGFNVWDDQGLVSELERRAMARSKVRA